MIRLRLFAMACRRVMLSGLLASAAWGGCAAGNTPCVASTFKDCPACPEMVVIPAGSFVMGDPGEEDERPVHRVRIASRIALGKTEVTQRQWRDVMGGNPSAFRACGDDCPVEQVSWYAAREFVHRLSRRTGHVYRLPSEAEWEYACRAGQEQAYCGGDEADEVAWHAANAVPDEAVGTRPVALKRANAWGLHDMSGNVAEWTDDCWHDDYFDAPTDGRAWTEPGCTVRVVRGGSWSNAARVVRATSRGRINQTERTRHEGFRVVRELP